MDLIYFLIDFILHIDVHLAELVAEYGVWVYAILFLILFCETGLVVTPFLPGDSLLFVAGALASLETNDLNVHMMVVLMLIAATVGDAVNYTIGRLFGDKCSVTRIRKSFVAVILIRLISFTRDMAAKRLFSPVLYRSSERSPRFVSGMGHMSYRHFAAYNVIGALLWVLIFYHAGYFFGTLPFIQSNLKLMIVGIIFVSILPGVFESIRHKRARHAPQNKK
ncbi:DedA family protein [Escherichia coli]